MITSTAARLRLLASVLAIVLAASACGSSSDDESADTGSDTTTAVAADGVQAGEGSDDGDSSSDEASSQEAPSDDGSESTDSGEVTEPSDGVERARLGDRMKVADLAATSGRFEGTISISGGAEMPQDIGLQFNGAFDAANDASEIEIDLGSVALAAAEQEGTDLGPMAALFEEPMIVRTIGTTSYVSWGLFTLLTGTENAWIEAEADDAGEITSSFGGTSNGSPVDLIAALEDANADITEVGTEDVRGVSTTHIVAIVDLAELDAELTDEERATIERDIGAVDIGAFPIEFWIDDDGLIRRYAMDLSEVAQAEGDIEQASLLFEFFDYGADISIEAPPADQIVSMDEFDPEAFGFGN